MDKNLTIKNGMTFTLSQLLEFEKDGTLVSYFAKNHKADIDILGPNKNIKYKVLEYIEDNKYARVVRIDNNS
jgi:hypothetical protein